MFEGDQLVYVFQNKKIYKVYSNINFSLSFSHFKYNFVKRARLEKHPLCKERDVHIPYTELMYRKCVYNDFGFP